MEGFGFPVEVVRTDRKKSASIQLANEGILIRVPRTLSDTRIRELIARRTPWIVKKLKEQAEQPVVGPKQYVSGETFPWLGEDYPLRVIAENEAGDEPSVELLDGALVAVIAESDNSPSESVRSMVMQWYLKQAQAHLERRTEQLARAVGVKPNSVSVKTYKSRWGSCSVRGDIAYNWRLVLAPEHIVDYVVVHELCHMLEHNHSRRFWAHVERHIPDWKARRDWLARLQISQW